MTGIRMRTMAMFAVTLIAAFALVACSSPDGGGGYSGGKQSGTDGNTVVEDNTQFQPSSLTVKPGDTVTFDNQDSVPHEVEIDGKSLGRQEPGKKVTWKATKSGSYPYRCLIHPSMTATLRVQ